MCAIESAALQGEASSVRNFMRRDRFPRAADVSKNDPHLRQALFLVFNGMDYYNPNVELKMDAFEVDHIWPVDRGGPDNIFNYAPTTKAFNIWKSNNYDAVSTNFFLSRCPRSLRSQGLQAIPRVKKWRSRLICFSCDGRSCANPNRQVRRA